MTTKGTDNRFRSLTVVGESGTPSTPASGDFKLYVADDGTFFLMDDTGATVDLTAGGFSDPMTTRGDIIVRNASNVTARLAKGSADTFLHSDGTDVGYAAVTDAMLSTSDITTNNASTSKHGFLRKLDNDAAHFLDGTGAWSTPSGGTALAFGSVKDSSGDHAITGATFADVDTTHCGFSITTGAHSILCGWSGSVFPDGTRRLFLDIAIDGTRIANTTEGAFVSNTVANFFSGSFTLISSPLSAGSHTVRLQARQSATGGSGTIGGGSSGSPVGFLWAVELAA